jgi:pimeloyl-ACP methyl ester carboxylesterase
MHPNQPRLAFTFRPGREPLLLFIHGLGADGHCFQGALAAPELRDRALLIPDLVGFGQSPPRPGFSYTMTEQAVELDLLCRSLMQNQIAIVAHSMGGAVGILLAERLSDRVTHFANAVGNLGPQDCFFSRALAESSLETFSSRGFASFKQSVKEAARATLRPASTYELALERTSAEVMHASSVDLVQLCDASHLLDRFVRLPCKKIYIHDEDNAVDPHVLKVLSENNVPTTRIPDAGHALMEENPSGFYSELSSFIARK